MNNCCNCFIYKYINKNIANINNKINNIIEIQDKVNSNIINNFTNYYALNEKDYTKTLTSEDDINTLEPGTYKIVSTDMPQNAPVGIGVQTYDATLVKSNDYMMIYEQTGYHFAYAIHIGDRLMWSWNDYISSSFIKLMLANYMEVRNYEEFGFSDVHSLTGYAAGVYTVDATVANLPVQTDGLLIIRQGVNKTDNYNVIFLPQNSNNIYKCCKRPNGAWSVWDKIAFMKNIPSLDGYATEAWVNQQIQDITGGSVTADWVKANTWTLTNIQNEINLNTYNKPISCIIPENTTGSPSNYGAYYCAIDADDDKLIEFAISKVSGRIYTRIFNNKTHSAWLQVALSNEIPKLNGYATQQWVQSQNYLTEIPDEYATETEVTQAIVAALVGYATQTWVNQQGFAKEKDIPSLSGYATQTWVNQQGFLTEIPEEYITQSELQAQNYATQTWVTSRGYQTSGQVDAAITEALNGYATQNWVTQQKFAHESDIPSLSGYATQSWVNNQNFATEEWVGQQGYQTVQQVNSLINTATADMLTQADLDTFNYATENWVLQTALEGYATTDDVTNATNKDNILKYQLDHSYFDLLSTNDDLNNLSIGVYASDSAAITSTLLNKPDGITRGFKLTMSEIVGETYCSQTIIENITGNIYIRCSENNIWNEWRKI